MLPRRGAQRAIDTNVVVRFLVADDRRQAQRARQVIEGGGIYLGATVLLESEWVLRSGYGLETAAIATALRVLAGLPGMTVEHPAQFTLALDWMEKGMDFADALHLAKAQDCEVFLTFDRKLARRAKALSPIPVSEP